MKRRKQLLEAGFNPQPNGDWIKGKKVIKSRTIRNTNEEEFKKELINESL